jgi:selenocysteine-specific elongation factor
MVLIGTSGHVDHGKSTLVEALTGINPMHLPEEHRRELTIELGFAHLRHPDGYTLGIVDVPGHEKLVKTMIAGASGFQIALWVVDAREGLMPQSFEHLDVLKLLGVPRIIPVVTKAGLATRDAIQEAVRAAQRLVDGPVHIVDSLSKAGIPELCETLFAACRSLAADKSRIDAPVYMPIDRCFALKGVGTVVTGTLVRGELRVGQSVSLSSHPDEYRIRSLHNHNAVVDRIAAGHRVGVHVHGLKLEDVERGDVLIAPEYPARSRYLNVTLELLKDSAFRWKPGLRAHFLAASFEMECRLWGLVQSGTNTWVQIHLPREGCFFRGQRFILRSTNPLRTIGGGTIVDIAPDRPRRITEPERDRDHYLDLSRPNVFERVALAKKWMCADEDVKEREARSASGLIWHKKMDDVTGARVGEWIARAKNDPAEWPFEGIASALKIKPAHVRPYLESFLSEHFKGVLTMTSSTLRYDPRRGELSDVERRAAEELHAKLRAAKLKPLRLEEYRAGSGVEKKAFDKAAATMIKEGRVVRVDNEFVVERSVWDELADRVRKAPAESYTASEFGQYVGLSRKYSVPYLECLNRMGILRRQGDRHVVMRGKVVPRV